MSDVKDYHSNNWVIPYLVSAFLILNFFTETGSEDINLALRKPTKQSSTHYYFKSKYAVDGDFGNNIYRENALCAQTKGSTNDSPWLWWMVDLQKIYTVGSFSYTCRIDADHYQNKMIAVEVSTVDPTTLNGFPGRTNASECLVRNETLAHKIPRFTLQCEKPVKGRYVRVVKYKLGSTKLTICEFEIFEKVKGVRQPTTNRKNVALNKPTSTDGKTFHTRKPGEQQGASPVMAVDGNRDGYSGSQGNCFSSGKSEPFAIFLIDLLDVYIVDTIFITNNIFKPENLKNFTVEVSMLVPTTTITEYSDDYSAQVCHRQIETVPFGYTVCYKCKQPIIGRYVRLVKFIEETSVLNLCELEVYGTRYVKPQPPNGCTISPTRWRLDFVKSQGHVPNPIRVSDQILTNACIRERVMEGVDSSTLFIQMDLLRKTCLFLNNVNEGENFASSYWVIYKLVIY